MGTPLPWHQTFLFLNWETTRSCTEEPELPEELCAFVHKPWTPHMEFSAIH